MESPHKQTRRTAALAFLLLIGAFFLFSQMGDRGPPEIAISDVIADVRLDKIGQAELRGGRVCVEYKAGKAIRCTYTTEPDLLIKALDEHKVTYREYPVESGGIMSFIGSMFFPLLMLVFMFWFFRRQSQQMQGRFGSIGRTRRGLLAENQVRTKFDDVAGIDEAKEEAREVVEFLKDPKKFTAIGARLPKGLLLIGPSGTGKTLLARAIAGEAGVPFFSMSGSDFVEMFVGIGAARVRDLFDEGRKKNPCVIFIDEIDAVGKKRNGTAFGGGHDEREQTLNQILVELDGLISTDNLVLIGATNVPEVLDPALTRPGRFDRQVVVPPPDVVGREAILRVHEQKYKMGDDVDFELVARLTPGAVGADLENLLNEAAIRAVQQGRERVSMLDIEYAREKMQEGKARRLLMSDKQKADTARHETGHTLVAMTMPGADPVHKVTIIPHGRALGFTLQRPSEDRYSMSRTELLTEITILLGGWVAESFCAEGQSKKDTDLTTTGVSNDLERATALARDMVTKYGMSEAVGLRTVSADREPWFGGKKDVSEATAALIDQEIKKILDDCLAKANRAICANLKAFWAITRELTKKETLYAEDLQRIMAASATE